jgi:hypothetical protein
MQSRYLRFFTVALVLTIGFAWLYQANTTPTTADFAPTHSPREAAARVYAAQQKQETQHISNFYNTDPSSNVLPETPTVYFPQTGHHLSNRSGFLDFWRANGRVKVFGYPISEEMIENDRVVQYFERVRLEYHPELAGTGWEIQLGLLGNDLTDGATPTGVPDPQNGQRYFYETQHTLYSEFQHFWQRRGELQIFGYPISEPFQEHGRMVQYFERARFEYYPEDMAPFFRTQEQYYTFSLNTLHEIVLGDLGRQVAAIRGVNTAPVSQLEGTPVWNPALWKRHIDIDLSKQWLTAYEDDLLVYEAPVTTGRDGFNTPAGSFAIYNKLPLQTMSGSAGGESWYVPNVPWVMYISGGIALHGTYWHNLFGSGVRLSHGCINLPIDDAQWLYEWADIGTTVRVHY